MDDAQRRSRSDAASSGINPRGDASLRPARQRGEGCHDEARVQRARAGRIRKTAGQNGRHAACSAPQQGFDLVASGRGGPAAEAGALERRGGTGKKAGGFDAHAFGEGQCERAMKYIPG